MTVLFLMFSLFLFFFLMIRRPPRSTRTDTLFPYTTLFRSHSSAREVFEAAGFTDVTTHSSSLPPRELRQALHGANLIGIRSRTNLTAEILSGLPDLRAVGCFCIGTNQVTLDQDSSPGTQVLNAPYTTNSSVAEMLLVEE